MKSDDFPGKPKVGPAIKGLKAPTPITTPDSTTAQPTGRAAMLQRMSQDSESPQLQVPDSEAASSRTAIHILNVDQIVKSPFQPRLVFDQAALEELGTSIQTIGLGQPILVRPLPNGLFELIGGERRWRASKLIGNMTIEAMVKPMPDALAMLLALTDNDQEDLTDYEKARSYHRLLTNGEDSSMRALARRLGTNHSVISRLLQLIQLPERIRTILDGHPSLITANYAKDFKDLATINEDFVVDVVEKMASSGLPQQAALRLIKREVDSASRPEAKQVKKSAIDGIGTLRILGDRVEVKCAKGIDATKLAQEFVTFLHSLDKAQILGADESPSDQ
ncbi:ParB family partitioning protein [Pseudomonas savastanoi pv. glycinea]|uniref:ParB family partitioning protein n=2 Tax=Pseudomonas savastanoi pv. glycinea TaxID=318 RepID=A0A3M3JJD0_PSESG|nr:ParB/RepB/Spo0J family partition protein [Pseudomonas savastanoi]EFW82921.1 ParB family partitioning protein [Pseudomonas savastanoi pv. glycinea str. race 4]EGH16876.1 ParB family partitioning protein [Pseudomonas savastanoi pv. glycinea str. race 4]MCQ3008598.1 ParB/RepB/Spo0J family partition protein [Pseudomonas savastanoi]RMN10281.1 ParB family partitioning protein [Pseudomonas savastanoi pv. glycinea]RMO41750.1 ParB family partitioning protein [Pseudomonas savastanoi pv. glycinea]